MLAQIGVSLIIANGGVNKMADHVFHGITDKIIYQNATDKYDEVINRWAGFVKEKHRKGLIPLFITGLGVSKDDKNSIPDMYDIVAKLKEAFNEDNNDERYFPEIKKLLETLKKLHENDQKDRSTVARLLNAFQEREDLREKWKSLNREWLLPAILNANPTPFHKALANLYESFDAVNITLNFDGLLIREFEINRKEEKGEQEKAFSLPIKEECESFFLRPLNTDNTVKEYLEIQIRGDILYVECDAKEFYCPNKDKRHSLWAPIASYPASEKNADKKKKLESDHFLKCPYCGHIGVSFLSFPGSYEKERDMIDMLEIVWKYLAFRVGSVTVVGTSGEWDPLIVAFLGDLLTEREIPLLVVDHYPEGKDYIEGNRNRRPTYIIKELIDTKAHNGMALGVSADQFMIDLTGKLSTKEAQISNTVENTNGYTDDEYWYDMAKDTRLKRSVNLEYSQLENNVRIKLKDKRIDKFAQLGLKSYWMGIQPSKAKRYHTRFQHSIGAMKVGSYLYDNAIKHACLEENRYEKQFLRLAALLHDIGHLPFSHLIEDVFNELNWKPAGYKDHYSHVFQTDKEIEELFNDNGQNLKTQLEETGYCVTDIIKLVNGHFGVGYLDAIINSSIDADKIDYVFRDTYSTGRKTSLEPVQFLKDIVNGLSITPEKYLSFSGVSAMAAVGLLRERQRLYRSLYLQPGIVVLEGIVKLIIKTYFVHLIKLDNNRIIDKMKLSDYDFPDLGDYKISYCITDLKAIFNELTKTRKNKNFELEVVGFMFDKITANKYTNVLSSDFLQNITKGFETINKIQGEGDLKRLEQKVTHKRLKGKKEKIQEIARDVMFRMPSNAIVAVIKPSRFLSSAESRNERERSDGTKSFSECILVPENDHSTWNTNDKAVMTIHDSKLNDKDNKDENISVYMYPLSDDTDNSHYKYSLNLFKKLSNENSISEIA